MITLLHYYYLQRKRHEIVGGVKMKIAYINIASKMLEGVALSPVCNVPCRWNKGVPVRS